MSMIDVTPSQFKDILKFMVPRQKVVMVTGAPGTGKTTIVRVTLGEEIGYDMLWRWPGTEDPTIPGGFPWCYQEKGKPYATLVMYEMNKVLMNAKRPTVMFLDDFGQATNAVQSAYMPLLLDRKVGGTTISDHISFVMATNRREDRANVSGVLLPVRSRCTGGIYNLITSVRDWCLWALKEGLPIELIQYIKLMESRRENRLLNENPPKEICGYYCPRTVAEVGYAMKDGLPKEMEQTVFSGICGEEWATEICAFFKIARDLPSKEQIIAFPTTAPIPDVYTRDGAALLFAVCGMLTVTADDTNFDSILQYAKRLPAEYCGMLLDDIMLGKPELQQNKAYIQYLTKESRSNVGL